jgi:hypothetical protein
MNLQSRIIFCLLAVSPVQVFSQASSEQETGAIADAESQFLFINMLEFLAEFETEDGEWISPDVLANDVFTDLDVAASDSSGANDSEQRQLNRQAGTEQ